MGLACRDPVVVPGCHRTRVDDLERREGDRDVDDQVVLPAPRVEEWDPHLVLEYPLLSWSVLPELVDMMVPRYGVAPVVH